MSNLTLRQARLISGLSQKELGELVGVHATTIAIWEKNPEKISISNDEKITQLLNVDFDIFLNQDSTKRREHD